jgi:small subunit ribosomal protein S6
LRQYLPEPRHYELMTILSPEVPDDELQGQLDTVARYVAAAGGAVTAVNRDSPWGRRRLAYPIRHNGRDVRDGYYTVFHLRLAPTRVVEVERDLKLNGQVLRYLITQYEPKATEGEPGAEAAAVVAPATPAATAETEPAAAAEPSTAATVAASEATDSQPQVATTSGTEEQAGAAPATTPGEEPENPPAQPATTAVEG